jgi:fructose-1-phosphate kinase PfkB-like protein
MNASYTAKKISSLKTDYNLELKNSDGELLLNFGGPNITKEEMQEFKKESLSRCTHERGN